MALRYITTGTFPDLLSTARGSIAEILATIGTEGTIAYADDAPGGRLESHGGKWYGDLGTMPKATADALYASGALVNLATGATYRDTSGTQYTYSVGAGWVMGGGIPHYAGGFLALPNTASDGDLATIPQLIGGGRIRMQYIAASGQWEVEPGQCIINADEIFSVSPVAAVTDVFYNFPNPQGLILPKQTWEILMHATGAVAGALNSGFRTRLFGCTTNSAKTSFSQSIPKNRSRKAIYIRADSSIEAIEFDSGPGAIVNDPPNYLAGAEIYFQPAQIGDSFQLRSYTLRRLA